MGEKMKNTFGNNLSVTLFGESHGPAVGCVIDGIAPGIKIDINYVKLCLAQRSARSDISTPRRESDEIEFISGYDEYDYDKSENHLQTIRRQFYIQ